MAHVADQDPALRGARPPARRARQRAVSGLSFDFTDDQRRLRKTVRAFVERECPKALARAAELETEFPQEIAERIAGAGLNGIGIPEEFGGEGGDLIDQVIVCEELSR